MLKEDWRGESLTSFVGFGERAFEALTLPYCGTQGAEPGSEKYEKVEFFDMGDACCCVDVESATCARIEAFGAVGDAVDLPENEGMDAMPGTLGELFRYGTVYLRQRREWIERMVTPRLSRTWKKGVFGGVT